MLNIISNFYLAVSVIVAPLKGMCSLPLATLKPFSLNLVFSTFTVV